MNKFLTVYGNVSNASWAYASLWATVTFIEVFFLFFILLIVLSLVPTALAICF